MNPRVNGSADALVTAVLLGKWGYACFPCKFDKTPACPHGFKDATQEQAGIRKLWDAHPGLLVGVATGPASGIAVVDIDKKHPEATAWWLKNKGQLMPTRAHRTRSGGLHLIYDDYAGLKCSTSRIARGVDVRANGGYIIWWPQAGFDVLSDAIPVEWPAFLEYLAKTPEPEPEPPPPPRNGPPPPEVLLARVTGLLRFVQDAPVGERNARLYWATCRVRDMILSAELSSAGGNQVFKELHYMACAVGLSSFEAERTIKSAALARCPDSPQKYSGRTA